MRYGRIQGFHKTLELFHQRGGKVVVEIGSIREKDNIEGDGYSTVCWAMHTEEVWSVDIDFEATKLTLEETAEFNNVIAVHQDGIEFLNEFDKPIDLLYLDGWDAWLKESKQKHLEAYLAAKHNLHLNSLVLIDDAQRKGVLAIPAMVDEGWQIVFSDDQTLLSK